MTIDDVTLGTNAAANAASIVSAINNKSASTGVAASVNASNKLTITASDGRNIELAYANSGSTAQTGIDPAIYHGTVTLKSYRGSFSLSDPYSYLDVGSTSATATAGGDSVATISLLDKQSASNAIETIDSALRQLDTTLSGIGAQTNRLTAVASTLSATSEQSASANSRILDADFASETSAMTRGQILQQAAVSVLAQANKAPQLALSLLAS